MFQAPYGLDHRITWSKVSGGEALAVDLATVKEFTNRALEDDTWDAELTRFVRTAQLAVEKHVEMALTPIVWSGAFSTFLDQFRLIRRPFVKVNKIDYVQPDGEIVTLPTDHYHAMRAGQDVGIVCRSDSLSWPDTARRLDAVRVEVLAGYGQCEDEIEAGHELLPDDIQHAILMTVASLEQGRGDVASSSDTTVYAMKAARKAGAIPQEARALLAPYRYVSVAI